MRQITCPHCADTYPDFDVAHVCSKGPYAPKLKPKMNERIKLLAEQATTYIEPTSTSGEGWIFDKEKFVQLIVDECCTRLSEEIIRHDGYGFNQHELYNKLRKHFGIDK
jgi:hypothetical protein